MHPILSSLDWVIIETKWAILTTGVILTSGIFLKTVKRKKLNLELLYNSFYFLLIGGLIGSRLGFAVENSLINPTEITIGTILDLLKIWNDNWSFWIGLVTIIFLSTIVLFKKDRENLKKWADSVTVPLLILLVVIHISDFFEGTNYGKPSDAPWAIIFENPMILYTVPIHPTQLYAALYSIGIILLVTKYDSLLNSILPKQDGQNAICAAFLYSLLRFLEGFLRGDEVVMLFGIRVPELISLIVFAGLLTLVLRKRKQQLEEKTGEEKSPEDSS